MLFKQSVRERGQRLQSTQAPATMRGMLSDVVRSRQEAADIPQRMGGRDARPTRPVMVDTGHSRSVIIGDGVATAAELSELAIASIEKQEAQRSRTGTDADFDALRERAGMMRREEVGPKMREAMAARAERARRNMRTDPAQYQKGH